MTEPTPIDRLTAEVQNRIKAEAKRAQVRNQRIAGLVAGGFLAVLFLGRALGWWGA